MSNKEKLELLIKEQGDIVRKLKQAKENKDKVRMVVVLHHAVVANWMSVRWVLVRKRIVW